MERRASAPSGGPPRTAPAADLAAAAVEGRGWARFHPLQLRSALASLRHRSVQGAMQANGTATSALSGGRLSTALAAGLAAAAVEGRSRRAWMGSLPPPSTSLCPRFAQASLRSGGDVDDRNGGQRPERGRASASPTADPPEATALSGGRFSTLFAA